MCCLCCRSNPQCARATHSSPAMAALTAQALHSPAVCAMQPVTLGMWVRPGALLLARQTGLTVLWREHAVSLVRTKSATCVPLSCIDADLTRVSRVQSGQCRLYIVCHPTGIIHMASNPFNHALSQLCAWQTCDRDSHDHGTNILIPYESHACLMLVLLTECTGNPAQPSNGSFDCPSPARPGSVCNATCNDGYVGAPFSTCQLDGTYSAVNGSCELIGGSRNGVDALHLPNCRTLRTS